MVSVKQLLLYPALASGVTLILHFIIGFSFGASAFVAFLGWPVIGTFVTADDDLPGGWSNPDGSVTPPWRTSVFWAQLTGGASVSAFVTAFDIGTLTRNGFAFAVAGLAFALVSIRLLRHHFRSGQPVG